VIHSITPSLTPQLGRAWQRMKLLLFAPFDLQQWFVLGFAAFLVSLADGGGDGILKFSERFDRDRNEWGWGELDGLYERVISEAWLIMLVSFLLMAGLVLGVVFLWLSSRGRFVLVDNLVKDRPGISAPWNEYSAQGNSLFLWQLGFALVCLIVFGMFGGLMLVLFIPLGMLDAGALVAIPAMALAGALGLALILVTVYVEFFLHNFVVTIMYRDKISTTEAWRRFTPLFSQYPGWFVLYGMFYLLVAILGFIALVTAGLVTCCIGLVLLMIPYIGSVLSLPLTVTLRYWDLEFLGQFGPNYTVLGPVPPDPDHKSVYSDRNGQWSDPRTSGKIPARTNRGLRMPEIRK